MRSLPLWPPNHPPGIPLEEEALRPARQAWSEGNRLFLNNDFPAAYVTYIRGLQHAPHEASLWFAVGAAISSMKTTQKVGSREAMAAFLKALSLRPHFPEALLSLANELYHDGNYLAAATTYLRAIVQRPLYEKAHCNLGNALSGLRRYQQAINCYEYALKLKPDMLAAHHNMGNAFLKRREYTRAEECFRTALKIDPNSSQLYNSLGNAQLKQNRPDLAEASYRRAVELDPNYSAGYTNLANALLDLQRYEEMEHYYRRAVELDPTSSGGHYNLALACLRAGNFREGWQRYEWRWDFRDLNMERRKFPNQPPQWKGQSLEGKTILLHAEQGMGDTLQFARFLPLVAERAHQQGGRILLEVQPRLKRFFAAQENTSLLGTETVFAKGELLPLFDLHCPLMSLPAIFDTTLETLPTSVPYLHAADEDIAAARQSFPRKPSQLRVGLVWEGNLHSKSNLRRTTKLESLLPILSAHGADFYSLQFGPGAKQLSALPDQISITDACSTNKDVSDAAAFIATLDLVITVDTSIAHLAGAMGMPVWIMLPYRGDWRWMENTSRSPWYPTARLFRQPAEDDWASLAADVRNALDEKIHHHDFFTPSLAQSPAPPPIDTLPAHAHNAALAAGPADRSQMPLPAR